MPWSVRRDDRCPAGKPWGVANDKTGKLHGCHPTAEKAREQQQALYANVPEDQLDPGDPHKDPMHTGGKQHVLTGDMKPAKKRSEPEDSTPEFRGWQPLKGLKQLAGKGQPFTTSEG